MPLFHFLPKTPRFLSSFNYSFLPLIIPFFHFSPHRNSVILSTSAWHPDSALQTYQLFTTPHRKPFPLSSHPSAQFLFSTPDSSRPCKTVLLFQTMDSACAFSPSKYTSCTPFLDNRLASYYL